MQDEKWTEFKYQAVNLWIKETIVTTHFKSLLFSFAIYNIITCQNNNKRHSHDYTASINGQSLFDIVLV